MTKLRDKNFKIFVDFDGTITKKDVGEALFLKFGDADRANAIVKLWMEDKISSTESWIRLCEMVGSLSKTELESFIDTIEVEPSFKEFTSYCEDNNFDIFILSDGLSIYIDRILKRENLDHLPVFYNRGILDADGYLIPSFPYPDEECDLCANCKRNHVISNSHDLDFTIYIGDGYSDRCPAQHVDFIFAKKSLLKYLETNRISYYPFDDFDDVLIRLKDLNNRAALKKRHQAELNRRTVYMQG